jgi:hypothetical protein
VSREDGFSVGMDEGMRVMETIGVGRERERGDSRTRKVTDKTSGAQTKVLQTTEQREKVDEDCPPSVAKKVLSDRIQAGSAFNAITDKKKKWSRVWPRMSAK